MAVILPDDDDTSTSRAKSGSLRHVVLNRLRRSVQYRNLAPSSDTYDFSEWKRRKTLHLVSLVYEFTRNRGISAEFFTGLHHRYFLLYGFRKDSFELTQQFYELLYSSSSRTPPSRTGSVFWNHVSPAKGRRVLPINAENQMICSTVRRGCGDSVNLNHETLLERLVSLLENECNDI